MLEAEIARIIQTQAQWKWEAIPHGKDAFLVSFPSFDDLHRMADLEV